MPVSRRDALKGLLVGSALPALPAVASATSEPERFSFVLSNGLRVHCRANGSGYVSAALLLRSQEIGEASGLAHLMEHTSFSGAAGSFSAEQIRETRQDCIQDSNATTAPGTIQWNASFLPRNTEQALKILAVTSLDQKFDVETVGREARVVLQELYLGKYDTNARAKQQFSRALYGGSHPYARETLDTEIRKARTPPERLAGELSAYAATIRLPANMDLFLVGELEPQAIERVASEHFGRCPFARGPIFDLPRAQVTRAYNALTATSSELHRPLSELRIAWNTGVRVGDPEAATLLALSECLNSALYAQIRGSFGETYTPEASYDPDNCCGIFEIVISSSTAPDRLESRVFETVAMLKQNIDPKELNRFRDRFELKRRKQAQSNDAVLDDMVNKVLYGASTHDFEVNGITPDEVLAAARKYLPAHKGAYVRLALLGR